MMDSLPADVLAAYWAGCPVARAAVVAEMNLAVAIGLARTHLAACDFHDDDAPAPVKP